MSAAAKRARIAETPSQRAQRLRCAACGSWFMSTAQRDAHQAKRHGG